jgi:hypothetical protein
MLVPLGDDIRAANSARMGTLGFRSRYAQLASAIGLIWVAVDESHKGSDRYVYSGTWSDLSRAGT